MKASTPVNHAMNVCPLTCSSSYFSNYYLAFTANAMLISCGHEICAGNRFPKRQSKELQAKYLQNVWRIWRNRHCNSIGICGYSLRERFMTFKLFFLGRSWIQMMAFLDHVCWSYKWSTPSDLIYPGPTCKKLIDPRKAYKSAAFEVSEKDLVFGGSFQKTLADSKCNGKKPKPTIILDSDEEDFPDADKFLVGIGDSKKSSKSPQKQVCLLFLFSLAAFLIGCWHSV